MDQVKVTERGWAGHFICGHRCRYRRNTVVEHRDRRIVVSNVGLMPKQEYVRDGFAKDASGFEQIACDRFYETMAFKAALEDGYWEADVGNENPFASTWSLNEAEQMRDGKANDLHDAVVRELAVLINEAA